MFRQFIIYIIVKRTKEQVFGRKECAIMNKRQDIIDRIEKLTPEQFETLLTLYSLQEQESAPAVPVGNPTYFPHAG